MYLVIGILIILVGLVILRHAINSWIKEGIFFGNVFKGIFAGAGSIVLGIVLIIEFFSK